MVGSVSQSFTTGNARCCVPRMDTHWKMVASGVVVCDVVAVEVSVVVVGVVDGVDVAEVVGLEVAVEVGVVVVVGVVV